MKSYQTKADQYDGIARQYTKDLLSARGHIQSTEKRMQEVSNKLNTNLSSKDRLVLEDERKNLAQSLDELNKRLHRVETEKIKLEELRDQSDRKINQLEHEIDMMKSQKVALSRKMKDETTAFKKFEEEQRREMIRLKLKLKSTEMKYEKLEQHVQEDKRNALTNSLNAPTPTPVSARKVPEKVCLLGSTSQLNSNV
jgi:chromosome segregation ATPase